MSVVCGEWRRSPIDRQALTNPVLLVEVTSRSSDLYDRNAKLEAYKQLLTLQHVLIVSHRRPLLTLVSRTADGWTTRDHVPGETITLATPELGLAVGDVFAGLPLETD